jgi:phage terminase large subunit-like protein
MPGSRGAVVAATAADARDVLAEGESGFMHTSTDVSYEPSKRRLSWGNGSRATLFSADEPNRLRGPQFHWAICDELAAWRFLEDAWSNLMLGLRLGDNPRCVVATTPRPIKQIKAMLTDPTVTVTRGSTYDNRANLAPQFFAQIVARYEGTRLGRQEIDAQILDDVPGALWQRAMLDEHRVASAPELTRIVVAIDPAVTNTGDSNEHGVIVAGKGTDEHGYVLDDLSLRASPDGWARAAIKAYHDWQADRIVIEDNQGGDMCVHTLRTVERTIPITRVHASRGKQTRAEPIAALYEQGRVHHVGALPDLEDQLVSWTPGDASPDRLDACVWALTDLMLKRPLPAVITSYQG